MGDGVGEREEVSAFPAFPPDLPGSSRPLLTWGILAAGLGCIPFTCVLGVVFGILGLSKAARHIRFTGSLYGPARAGRILSIVGIAAGAVVSVLTVLWIIHLTR